MRSTNRPYLYPVDALRALAAMLVVLYHSTQLVSARIAHPGRNFSLSDWPYSRNPLKTLVYEGHTGVALFMVLSGFIFTNGTLGRHIQYRSFLVNRLLRIYPLYLILVVLALSLAPRSFTLSALIQTVLPLASFGGPLVVGGAWGAMFWAVSVEFQFYLIFPLLLSLLNRFGPSVLVRLIAAFAVLRVLAVVGTPALNINNIFYFSIIGRIDQFLFGMLIAWVYMRHRSWLGVPVLVLSSVSALAMLWAFNQLHGYAHPAAWRAVWTDVEGAVWALFVGSFTHVFTHRRGLVMRASAAVGTTSFSIYLLHFVVVSRIASTSGWPLHWAGPVSSAFLTGVLLVVPVVLAVAFITYQSIERPFLALRLQYLDPADRHPLDPPVEPPDPFLPAAETAPPRTVSLGSAP